jgi:hypothetical protein
LVSVSLLGAGVSALANQGTGYLREGVVPQRMGNDHPVICPYGTIFECADGGLVTLAVGSDAQWQALSAVLQIPDDERFLTNPLRVEYRDACKRVVQEKITMIPKEELLRALREAAVPAGGVNSMEDVFAQPQAEELVFRRKQTLTLGITSDAENEAASENVYVAASGHKVASEEGGGDGIIRCGDAVGLRQVAFKEEVFHEESSRDRAGGIGENVLDLTEPPRYAEHTRSVLMEHAGFSAEEVMRLVQSGAAEAVDL